MWHTLLTGDNKLIQVFEAVDTADVGVGAGVTHFSDPIRIAAYKRLTDMGVEFDNPLNYYLSKLTIGRRMRKMGLEDTFLTVIQQNTDAWRDWQNAPQISVADPKFLEMVEFFNANVGWTSDQIEELMRPGDEV